MIIKVPAEQYVSPHDGKPVRFDTDWHELYDEHDNRIEIAELTGSRPANRLKKQARELYPI